VTAVLLAVASAALFGGMTVAFRAGLRGVSAPGAAVATILPALAVCLVAAALRHDPHGAWPFLLTGLLAPGLSQILFTFAVREIGSSRTSVTVGTAPLVAVAVALVALDEPVRPALLLGAAGVVGGGILLIGERGRPEHLRARGIAFGLATTVAFALRDDLVRWLHGHAAPETAAAATLLAGAAIALLWSRRPPSRLELARLWPAGVCFGVSYVCLFEAYARGRVEVVSPLVATESLWGVALSALLLRRSEGVGRRLALGAVLVVAGGATIGAVAR
jgi:drug/metabolite transporter (DMT)-like permease